MKGPYFSCLRMNLHKNLLPATEVLKVDNIVLYGFFTTLSDPLQARLVVGRPKSAKEAWDLISNIVKDNKRSRTNALKAELRSIKLGDQSMESYFRKIESIVTILASLDSHVNDEYIVDYALEGLPEQYNQVCGYMHYKDTFPDLKTARSLVITEEMSLKSKSIALPVDSSFASPMILMAETGPVPNSTTPTGNLGQETQLPNAFAVGLYMTQLLVCGTWIQDFMTRRVLLRCDSTGDLYPVTSPSPIPQAFLVSPHAWHQQLGHPGNDVMRRLVSNNFISCNKEKPPVLCYACQLGKHVRLPFASSSTVVNSCFNIVHSDVWTSPISSLSGYKYYVFFLDHYSQFVWVYPLLNKSDVLSKFVLFRTYFHTQFKHEIKSFQCDHGGKFDNRSLHKLFSDNGIEFRFSCLKTSQQNGKSKRMVRTINNQIRTLFFQANLPRTYWVEALNMAVHLINIFPSTAINNDIPYTRLFGKNPDYSLLRTFGCLCYPHHKLEPRATPSIFLGHASNHRGYRCLELNTNKIIISRHVTFDETVFPYGTQTLPKAPTYAFLDDTYDLTPPLSSPPKTVATTSHANTRYKARLMANGSTQLEGVDVDETFSPVVKLAVSLWAQTSPSSLVSAGTYTAYLLLYVDDIVLTASSDTLLQRIIDSLHQEFSMTDLGSLNYFLGISVTRDSSGMFLSQKKYAVEILKRAHMVNCNPSWTPIDTKSKLGSSGDPVCLYMHDPREPHFLALKRILRYVCGTLDYGLQLFSSSTTNLVAYSDADGLVAPLLAIRLQAEYRGVANAVAETSWLHNLLRELHTSLSSATLVYCDNVSAVYLSCNPVQHQRTKHIEIDIHFVRDLVAAGQRVILKKSFRVKDSAQPEADLSE
ncbi:ribonuclease H-like domain-containing protein [Tanacetum coccineum]